jgi:Carboxyl transferase domain
MVLLLKSEVDIGHLTGIIANMQPVIFVPEANKATQFIRLCNGSNIPIVYLHNVTGFMVGKKTEAQGLIKAGAQLVNAVSNSKVFLPISQRLITGSSDQCDLRSKLRSRKLRNVRSFLRSPIPFHLAHWPLQRHGS